MGWSETLSYLIPSKRMSNMIHQPPLQLKFLCATQCNNLTLASLNNMYQTKSSEIMHHFVVVNMDLLWISVLHRMWSDGVCYNDPGDKGHSIRKYQAWPNIALFSDSSRHNRFVLWNWLGWLRCTQVGGINAMVKSLSLSGPLLHKLQLGPSAGQKNFNIFPHRLLFVITRFCIWWDWTALLNTSEFNEKESF